MSYDTGCQLLRYRGELVSGCLEVPPSIISLSLEDTADLMDTGVPLTKALRHAITGCDSQAVRVGLQEMLAQLELEGEDNLGSLHYPPQVFSRLAAPFLDVGQLCGQLPTALRDLAELLTAV